MDTANGSGKQRGPTTAAERDDAALPCRNVFDNAGPVDPLELSLFDEVADALRGLAPPELGEHHQRAHRYGVKVWFGPPTPAREHYEAQVVGAGADTQAKVLAIEVGFHCEYPKAVDNEAVIAHLLANEALWRRAVGREAQVGDFLGRSDHWRRVSETWPDPDLGDGRLVIELAARLIDYIAAIEPVRRRRPM